MQRPTFLHHVISAAAGAFASSPTFVGAVPVEARWPNAASFVTIGARYLRRFPHEADARLLRRKLFAGAVPATLSSFRAAVSAATASDFLAEDVVSIDGWVFARSEARTCALARLAERHHDY